MRGASMRSGLRWCSVGLSTSPEGDTVEPSEENEVPVTWEREGHAGCKHEVGIAVVLCGPEPPPPDMMLPSEEEVPDTWEGEGAVR